MAGNQKQVRDNLKNDIRNTVMEIIGRDGFTGVTSRNIGKYMGLKNVSLVNYYFKTKENLILETLKNNYFNVMKEIHESPNLMENPRDKLVAIFNKTMEILWKQPALIDLLYFDGIKNAGLVKNHWIRELLELQKQIALHNLSVLRQAIGVGIGEQDAWMKLFQIRGAIMFPPLSKSTIPDFEDYFSEPTKRMEYVRSVIDGICFAAKKY